MPSETEQTVSPDAPSSKKGVLRFARPRRKDKTLPRLEACLNCGTPTGDGDNFCPDCGQENQNETVGLGALASDLLAELASWDSKLVRTVLPLLFRPGFLTNEYNAGRRIRYLSPLKMYLVISALFFLAIPSGTISHGLQIGGTNDTRPAARIRIGGKTQAAAKIGQTKAVETGGPEDVLQIGQDSIDLKNLPKTAAAYDAQQQDPHNPHKHGFLVNLAVHQIIKAGENKQTFRQSVTQGLIDDLPKMMFFLLPLFAVLLKIAYWRSKRLYVEHLIFALHSHALTFALMTLAVLATRFYAGSPVVWIGFFVLTAAYLFTAMRRVYRQSGWKTFVKFQLLAFNYFVLLTVSFALTALVAFLRA